MMTPVRIVLVFDFDLKRDEYLFAEFIRGIQNYWPAAEKRTLSNILSSADSSRELAYLLFPPNAATQDIGKMDTTFVRRATKIVEQVTEQHPELIIETPETKAD